MRVSTCLLSAAVLLACSNIAFAKANRGPTLREEAEHACYNDATTLCNEFVPDEDKITTCMTAKRAQLSPDCRAVFDKGMKAR